MRFIVSLLITLFLTTQISNVIADEDIPQRPEPPRLVNDLAELLTEEEEISLENKLVDFNDSTSTQIQIVTVKSLNGYDPADFTYKIGETWGVGQKGFDNGIVIMVKPRYPNEKGEVYIAVGYGIEAVVPDATAKRIVEDDMIPYFKQGNVYGGINAATDKLIELSYKEFKAPEKEEDEEDPPLWALIIASIIVFALSIAVLGFCLIIALLPFYLVYKFLRILFGFDDYVPSETTSVTYSSGAKPKKEPKEDDSSDFWSSLSKSLESSNSDSSSKKSSSSSSSWRSSGSSSGSSSSSSRSSSRSSSSSSSGSSSSRKSFGGYGGGSFGGGGAGGSW